MLYMLDCIIILHELFFYELTFMHTRSA